MPKGIKIAGFKGMDNVRPQQGALQIPRVLLNANVTAEGVIEKRPGQTQHIALPGAHSLWAGPVMLCVAAGTLYQIINGTAVSLATGLGSDPMGYVGAVDRVYLSSKSYNGVLDLGTMTVGTWGLGLPESPVCSAAAGDLLTGVYHLCFTTYDGAEISGNGPVIVFELTTAGGIALTSRPANTLVWCTDANEDKLFLAGDVDTVGEVGVEMLPSLNVTLPPQMEFICLAHGRIWGSVENTLHYSDAHAYEWFRTQSNRVDFEKNIKMVAPVRGGIYLGFVDEVIFLAGREPAGMDQTTVSNKGIVPYTLAYGDDMGDLGQNIPVWVGRKGIFAGTNDGQLVELTAGKIKFDAPASAGAGLFHQTPAGEPQYMAAFEQPSNVSMGDQATVDVVRNGKVI